MFTIPNILSLMRFPLAFLFLIDNTFVRVVALLCAGLTDFLDGYIARNYKMSSKLGTIIDPLGDKFFVTFLMVTFYLEGRLTIPQGISLMCRDFSVMFFGLYLIFNGNYGAYRFRAIWCGKVVTTMQFALLLALTLKLPVPSLIYFSFIFVGLLAFVELYKTREVQTAA